MRTYFDARWAAAVAAALIAAGCGGGASRAVPPAAHRAPDARLSLGIHFGGVKMSSSARAARYVSTATSILAAAVGSAAPAYFNVAATSPLCTGDGTGGRTCTIMLNAAASPDAQTMTVGTYKTAPTNPNETLEPNAPPASDLLSTGTTAVTVVAGVQNAVDVALAGVPAKLAIAHISSGLGNEQQPVAVTAYDASGARIITSRDASDNEIPYETPIAISVTESSPAHLVVDKTALAKPSDVLHALYQGFGPDGYHATIVASAGAATGSTTFTPFRLDTESQNLSLAAQTVPYAGVTTYATFTLTASEYGASSPVDVDLSDCSGSGGKPQASVAAPPAFAAGVLSATVYVTAAGASPCLITLTDADNTRRVLPVVASGPDLGPLAVAPSRVLVSNDGTRGPVSASATVGGGTPPYAVDASGCKGIAAVSFASGKFTVATQSISENCAVIVHDNASRTVMVPVEARVYGGAMSVAPSSISGWATTFPAFGITGGKPPYRVDMHTCFGSGIAISHSTTLTGGGTLDDFDGSLYLENPGSCTMWIFDARNARVDVPVTVT